MSKYQIIYADPPWQYSDKSKHRGGAERHYQTMSIDEIKALPVSSICADNAVLFLWVTFPQLQEGLALMNVWGFKYKTGGFTWVKTTKSGGLAIGMGHHTRANAEICLLGIRGKGIKRMNAGIRNTQLYPREHHSKKPDAFRTEIEKLYGISDLNPIKRIELFCRENHAGWDSWGNEVDGQDIFNDPLKVVA